MKYHVIKKKNKFMKPYVALHGELPKNELPKRMRHMHHHSIYINEDVCKNPRREQRILLHEYREMRRMEHGEKYKQAHKKAGY